jgi:hypothetical protein
LELCRVFALVQFRYDGSFVRSNHILIELGKKNRLKNRTQDAAGGRRRRRQRAVRT